jgi:fatty-acyl-CoA synthase
MTGPMRTLADVVKQAPDADGEGLVFHFEEGERRLHVADLRDAVVDRARQLVAAGVQPGEPIGLLGRNRPEWVIWAFAIWESGAVLMPLPLPVRVRNRQAVRDQQAALLRNAGSRFVISQGEFVDLVPDVVVTDWLDSPGVGLLDPSEARTLPEDSAIIICTSGSTATPKGILQRHSTYVSNLDVMSKADPDTPRPRSVNWLPFFHGGGLHSVVTGVHYGEGHFLPTERFARDPALWLWLVGETRATMTAAASSSWKAALRALERHPQAIDLSSLTAAFLSLEIVDAEVLERLIEVGGRFGLRPDAIKTAYGLSEGAGTMTPPGAPVRVDRIDLAELAESGRAVPAREGAPVKAVVSCGVPMGDVEIAIMGENGPLPERHVGEIAARGTMRMAGYIGDVEDPVVDGWLYTGDLGYLADGELFVTGRSKEIIISFGRNYHPEDIERAASAVAGVRPGGVVAFSLPEGKEGDFAIVVEATDATGLDLEEKVRRQVAADTGLVAREVVVAEPGTIPRTPTGKLQRLATQAAFGRGELEVTAKSA